MRRPIGDLDLFVAVANHRGFRRAAAETGVSASSLSDRLRALEEGLGTRLLNRTTRSVALTDAGAALLARLEPALAEVDSALADAAAGHGGVAGTLRLNVPRSAAQLVMPPLVSAYLAAWPKVTLEMVVEDGFVDIVEGGFDAGVRYGESLDRDMVAVPLGGTQRFALVASPAWLEANGPVTDPADVVDRPAILHRFPSGAVLSWEFERDGRTVTARPRPKLVCNDSALQVAAAESGAGLLMTFEQWVREPVRAGRLVSLLEDWLPPFPGPFLYYPSRRQMPPPLRAFVDLAHAMRKEGPW
jgi:DNA-binding transcriptional LysR family regulator